MTVTVFHWPYALRWGEIGLGHVALEVSNASVYRYLSWFPRDAKSIASLVAAMPVNHDRSGDEEKMGPAPDVVIIDGLDEQALVSAIDAPRPFYSLFGTSCAQTVADALRAGGGAERAPGITSLNPIWTPLPRISREGYAIVTK